MGHFLFSLIVFFFFGWHSLIVLKSTERHFFFILVMFGVPFSTMIFCILWGIYDLLILCLVFFFIGFSYFSRLNINVLIFFYCLWAILFFYCVAKIMYNIRALVLLNFAGVVCRTLEFSNDYDVRALCQEDKAVFLIIGLL